MILDILAYFIMFTFWVAITASFGSILRDDSNFKEGFKEGLLVQVAMTLLLGMFFVFLWAFVRVVS